MRAKGNQNHEAEEFDEEDFGSGKEGPSSNATSNNSGKISKDGKDSDKANAMRSKHSVTEQRRRSKINERFQILRDLIPHSEQKRDTASFLLEVIEYVQYLQEKVQKFEVSYQGWNSEPAKLVPWRNSHWRVQNFSGHLQTVKNGSGQPGSTVPGKYDETSITNQVIPINHPDSDPSKAVEQQTLSLPLHTSVRSDTVVANPLHQTVSSSQPLDFPITADSLDHPEELEVEGGTISISSVYSQGLLNNLTQALQNAGVDLSGANISVQIELGKKGNKELTSRTSAAKDSQSFPPRIQESMHLRDVDIGDDLNSGRKRQKT